jgi:ABC-type transport system involved in multi-copper enzyme maturation permease subunit
MNTMPNVEARFTAFPPVRSRSVIMGNTSFISVLLRLIGMELYKIRRRAMSKVLGTIAILAAVGLFFLISLGTIFIVNSPIESFLPPRPGCPPASVQPTNSPACSPQQPTAAELEQAKQNRQNTLQNVSAPLRLPTSLFLAVQATLTPFTVLIIILVGAIVGGEFSIGTVRLMFTRGPTRTQFLLAKIGAALICTVLGILGMTLLGILTGQLLNLISGIEQNLNFFDAAWLGHAILYLLIGMLDWFIYAMIALFFGIIGRSTVAGIVGALTWYFVEPILTTAFNLLSLTLRVDWLRNVPDYLIGNNIGALQQNQGQYLFHGIPSNLSNLHAIIVLSVYLAIFIGLSLWINERRDVTN